MFTETVLVKPKVDQATAKKMEQSLNQRFGRVAQRFGKGLKAIAKGTIIGISLGFLAKILAPLKEVEDRIKDLLGKGEDFRDLAEQYGTTQGKLQRLQDVSQVIGVRPDKLNDLMSAYADAIQRARDEMKDPTITEKSVSTQLLAKGGFLNDKDLADSFFSLIKTYAGANESQKSLLQKEVFGGGGGSSFQKLLGADYNDAFKKLGGYSQEQLNKSLNKISNLADQARIGETRLNQENIVKSAANLNPSVVSAMQASQKREQEQQLKELQNIEAMQKAQQGIDEISKVLMAMLDQVRIGVGYLGDLIGTIKKSSIFKGISKFLGN